MRKPIFQRFLTSLENQQNLFHIFLSYMQFDMNFARWEVGLKKRSRVIRTFVSGSSWSHQKHTGSSGNYFLFIRECTKLAGNDFGDDFGRVFLLKSSSRCIKLIPSDEFEGKHDLGARTHQWYLES
jgi:hypothetical protein